MHMHMDSIIHMDSTDSSVYNFSTEPSATKGLKPELLVR